MSALRDFLSQKADGDLVSWRYQQEAAGQFELSLAEVEEAILEAELLPARYQRNRQMLSISQQLQLFRSKVVVVGAGGLGGYIIEELGRLGVGQLLVIDDDVFEENNLNRQLLSSPAQLGRVKVEVAKERINEINPAVNLIPIRGRFGRDNGPELVKDADCIVDAVDNVTSRLDMEMVSCEAGLPLVHGAIAGWYGQVATVLPGDDSLRTSYRHYAGGKGVEAKLGNPSFTPAVAASLQVAEVCKILLKQGRLVSHRRIAFDLLDMEVTEIPFNWSA